MSKRIELGAIKFTMGVKSGEPDGAPRVDVRVDVLQDNFREVGLLVPDGEYSWVLVLDMDKAEKAE